jgi:hypothetical protein
MMMGKSALVFLMLFSVLMQRDDFDYGVLCDAAGSMHRL